MWIRVWVLRDVLVTLRIVRKPPTKLRLTAQELTVCVQLLSRGKSLADALEAIELQRAFIAQYHLEFTTR